MINHSVLHSEIFQEYSWFAAQYFTLHKLIQRGNFLFSFVTEQSEVFKKHHFFCDHDMGIVTQIKARTKMQIQSFNLI